MVNIDSSYIGFEGPIAAGKTTLATLLSRHLGAQLVLEEFEGNDFLVDFYQDRERWALPMQLWFLAARHAQLAAVPTSRSRPIVADYTYEKDAIFARLLLRDREHRLYETVSSRLGLLLPQPDLVRRIFSLVLVLLV